MPEEDSWDYIVVGAGPAGLSLAVGLSRNPKAKILLLEIEGSSAAPQPAVRPHVLEFDRWADQGAQGWTPEHVLPHFKSIEEDLDFKSLRYHGADGPLKLRRSPEESWSPLDQGFREAALEKGHPWALDHNAPGVLGVSPLAWSTFGDDSAATEVSWRAALGSSDNVKLGRVDAVDRVLWDADRASALRIRRGTAWEEVAAEEIVLCAGGIRTPSILQRSGLGPAEQLRAVGINVLHNLPVGLGLQVHPQLHLLLGNETTAANAQAQGGMLARWNTGLEGTASGDLMAWTSNGVLGGQKPGLVGALAQVFSRGSVSIVGPDPDIEPAVNSRMLRDSLDGYRFRLLYKHLGDLAARPALADSFAGARDVNGDLWRSNRDVADIDLWLRSVVKPMGDYASSCRMGEAGNPAAVVDGAGLVHGVKRLRVADCSISPILVRAAPLLMDSVIGSRMAQRILETSSP